MVMRGGQREVGDGLLFFLGWLEGFMTRGPDACGMRVSGRSKFLAEGLGSAVLTHR